MLNPDALTAAVDAYDATRCLENNRRYGSTSAAMSDTNKETIRPMIAAAVLAYLEAAQ